MRKHKTIIITLILSIQKDTNTQARPRRTWRITTWSQVIVRTRCKKMKKESHKRLLQTLAHSKKFKVRKCCQLVFNQSKSVKLKGAIIWQLREFWFLAKNHSVQVSYSWIRVKVKSPRSLIKKLDSKLVSRFTTRWCSQKITSQLSVFYQARCLYKIWKCRL